MKNTALFLMAMAILNPCYSWAQNLEVGLDWSMGAIVSSNDYTNGATDGTPSLSLAFDFEGLAAEVFYKNYKLAHTYENALGKNDIEVNQNILGFGVRIIHNQLFLTRFGLQYVDVETNVVNSNRNELKFDFDGATLGFYGGGGVQIPLTESLTFQTIGQLETSRKDLTALTLLFGFRYKLTQL